MAKLVIIKLSANQNPGAQLKPIVPSKVDYEVGKIGVRNIRKCQTYSRDKEYFQVMREVQGKKQWMDEYAPITVVWEEQELVLE